MIRRYGLVLPLAGLAAALLLAGCSQTTTSAPPNTTAVPFVGQSTTSSSTSGKKAGASASHTIITVTDSSASPAQVTIKPGTRVVWLNSGKAAHTISIAGGPTSPALAAGGTASHLFSKAGTYTFSDPANPATIHGTIIVAP